MPLTNSSSQELLREWVSTQHHCLSHPSASYAMNLFLGECGKSEYMNNKSIVTNNASVSLNNRYENTSRCSHLNKRQTRLEFSTLLFLWLLMLMAVRHVSLNLSWHKCCLGTLSLCLCLSVCLSFLIEGFVLHLLNSRGGIRWGRNEGYFKEVLIELYKG